jgi:hypothetical protein
MFKMGLYDPFGYLEHKLWLKSKIALIYLREGGVPHINGKLSTMAINVFRTHLNQRFVQEIMGLQSGKNPNFGNYEIPNLGVLGQNDIWPLTMWLGTKNTIREGWWWLPPNSGHGESCESVFAHVLSVHQKCFNYVLTNLLFGLCRSMWAIDPLVVCLNPHPEAPTHPSNPKCCELRSIPQLLSFHCFHIWYRSWIY